MTGRGGSYRDQTWWSAEARPVQRPVRDSEEKLRERTDALVDAETGRGGEAEPRPMQRPVQRPVVVKRSFSNRFLTRLLPIKFQFKETQINTN
jgi:hypothetical protein